METINTKTDGVLMCARMVYNTGLSRSVNGWAECSMLETIMLFTDYFSNTLQGVSVVPVRLELFLCEADMHTEQKPWQTTTFEYGCI